MAEIRIAQAEDASAIARLAGQLGYPSTVRDIEQRLETVFEDKDNIVLVATKPEGGIAGWIHVAVTVFIEEDTIAEIGGLVVDEGNRSAGIGQALLQAAEDWAKERGIRTLRVHSNVLRERAHVFYERHGFKVEKQQKVFVKRLDLM